MREAQRASNGLNILITMIRDKANQNDSHSSYDHDLKCDTSSIDPH